MQVPGKINLYPQSELFQSSSTFQWVKLNKASLGRILIASAGKVTYKHQTEAQNSVKLVFLLLWMKLILSSKLLKAAKSDDLVLLGIVGFLGKNSLYLRQAKQESCSTLIYYT